MKLKLEEDTGEEPALFISQDLAVVHASSPFFDALIVLMSYCLFDVNVVTNRYLTRQCWRRLWCPMRHMGGEAKGPASFMSAWPSYR